LLYLPLGLAASTPCPSLASLEEEGLFISCLSPTTPAVLFSLTAHRYHSHYLPRTFTPINYATVDDNAKVGDGLRRIGSPDRGGTTREPA